MKTIKISSIFRFALAGLLLGISLAWAQYEIPRSVFGSGGGITSNNEFQIVGTLGQPAIGEMSSVDNINLAGFWYIANFQPCTPGFFGDVSGDDVANSTDALIILSFDAGIPIPPIIIDRITKGFGDVNEDALTNSTDALIILSFDAGIPIPFPVGDPVCLPNGSSRSQGLSKKSAKAGEIITVSAMPTTKQIVQGMIIDIPVIINMSNSSEKLGSYTVKLEWNPNVLEFEKYSGGHTKGFENPVVNDAETAKGKIKIAHAYPFGSDGEVNILNLQFKVLGENGSSSSISMDFSAMAAAITFVDLLPNLQKDDMVMNLEVEDIPYDYDVVYYPNPFNPTTHIRFGLPEPSHVKIEVFNILGEKVTVLLDDNKAAGYHTIDFEGSNLASGTYLFRIQAGDYVDVKKLVLLR